MIRLKVNFPKSGMGIDEGTVSRWLVPVGEHVERGQVLAEIETAKAIQEIESPGTGILKEILSASGETVPVNSTLAYIESDRG